MGNLERVGLDFVGLLAGAESRGLRGVREAHRVTRLVAIDVDGTLLDGRGPGAGRQPRGAARGRRTRHASRGRDRAQLSVRAAGGRVAARSAHAGASTTAPWPERAAARRSLRRTLDPGRSRDACWSQTRGWRAATTVQFDRADAGQTLYDQLSWDHPNRRGYYAKVRRHVSQVDDLEAAMHGADPVQVAFNGPTADMRRLQDELIGGIPTGRRSRSRPPTIRRAISRSSTSTPPAPPRAAPSPPSPPISASRARRSSPSATTTTTSTCCSGPAPRWSWATPNLRCWRSGCRSPRRTTTPGWRRPCGDTFSEAARG